ncbi:MAG: hypothetical protein GX558_08290 [Clostridiales bacterium]|nr:hypothetical protein [Clostridiales bacterium]
MSIIASSRGRARALGGGVVRAGRRVVVLQLALSTALYAVNTAVGMLKAHHVVIASSAVVHYALLALALWQTARLAALSSPGDRPVRPLRMKEVWLGALAMMAVPWAFSAFLRFLLKDPVFPYLMIANIFDIAGTLSGRLMLGAAAVSATVVAALVLFAVNVFGVQWVVLAVDRGPTSGRQTRAVARNAIRYVLSPLALFFSYSGWMALAGVLFAVLVAVATAIAALQEPAPTELMSIRSLVIAHQWIAAIYATVTSKPWAAPLAMMLGLKWMLGIGVYLWPRFYLTQVTYHRDLLAAGLKSR